MYAIITTARISFLGVIFAVNPTVVLRSASNTGYVAVELRDAGAINLTVPVLLRKKKKEKIQRRN